MKNRLIELLEGTLEDWECDVSDKTISEIAEHLIENGVIASPCKVGDKIYQTDGIRIYESTINEITFTTQKMICVCVTENIAFDETAIGKSIFFDKKEAQAKLKGGEE
jgi:hypothetical protein